MLTAVNTDLKLTMDDMGPAGLLPSEYLTVARVLWRKHLEPEGLVELAQKALAKVEVGWALGLRQSVKTLPTAR